MVRKEFKVHMLTEDGKTLAAAIARAFDDLVGELESSCKTDTPEFTICKRKLEEACFYAKKSMAEKHCVE